MMPSKSAKQKRTMAGACKNPSFAKKMGIPHDVACEYFEADRKRSRKSKK